MNADLKLSLEGRANITSGKLLVIDPAYLADFDWQQCKRAQNALEDRFLELIEEEIEILEKHSKITRQIFALSDEEIIEKAQFLSNTQDEYETRAKMLETKRKALRAMPSLNPPFVAEGANYILFHNPIGDGYYPVVQDKEMFHIKFNYPLREKHGKIILDKSRLDGKLIGLSLVDSATQIITDFYNFSVKNDISPELYCCINVKKGIYTCKFEDDNDVLTIAKADN